jgi:haloacetate dehalogenase
MFEEFETFNLEGAGAVIHGRKGGTGQPLLLLHGFPETHLMWHTVAPALAKRFTVIVADLRGYGDSGTPQSSDDHREYSKRAMAADMVAVMGSLGYDRFALAGHDRGGRCAYRMALDYPDAVARLAVLDLIPTYEALNRADMKLALGFWPWSLLSQAYPFPETLIQAAPEAFVDHPLRDWSADPTCFSEEVRAQYERQFRDPDHAHAICEEYRAAATLDYEQDERDKGKRQIACPLLVLWGKQGAIEAWYRPLEIWRAWARDVSGQAINCGHFLPEEAPQETGAALEAFFSAN